MNAAGAASAVGVLAIHGIGEHAPGWSDRLANGVRRHLPYPGPALVWEEACWSDVIGRRVRAINARMAGKVADTKPRRMMDDYVPDALAYRAHYGELHDVVHRAYDRLRAALGPDAPVVVVAHSWGTVIGSDWVYDRRARGVAGLVTLGSPLRWTLAALGADAALDPVRPPRWVNIYDAHDPISSPLRDIAPEYAAAVHADLRVRNGSWWDRVRRFTSISANHDYSDTREVHEAIARVLLNTVHFPSLPPHEV